MFNYQVYDKINIFTRVKLLIYFYFLTSKLKILIIIIVPTG